MSSERVVIAGVPIDRLEPAVALDRIEAFLDEPGWHLVATCHLDFLRLAGRNPRFRAALLDADLVTADGAPVLWLARLAGCPLPARVTGMDLLVPLAARAARRGDAVWLLGGLPGHAALVARILQTRFPRLRIAGVDEARLEPGEPATIDAALRRVRASGAKLLITSLGALKAMPLLHARGPETGCRMGLDVGYAFAVHAGVRQRAPAWMRRAGAEWLWRVLQDPLRLSRRYLADALALPGLAWRAARDRSRNGSALEAAITAWDGQPRLPMLKRVEERARARIPDAARGEGS